MGVAHETPKTCIMRPCVPSMATMPQKRLLGAVPSFSSGYVHVWIHQCSTVCVFPTFRPLYLFHFACVARSSRCTLTLCVDTWLVHLCPRCCMLDDLGLQMATRSFLLSSPYFLRPTTATGTVTGERVKTRDVTSTNQLRIMVSAVRWSHAVTRASVCLLVCVLCLRCVGSYIGVIAFYYVRRSAC